MVAIHSAEELRGALGGLDLSSFSEVLALSIRRAEADLNSPFVLEMHLARPERSGELVVELSGVREFFLRKEARMQVMGLALDSVERDGWEGIRWRLLDVEDDFIGCYGDGLSIDATRA